jgi:spore coat protein U-like protein
MQLMKFVTILFILSILMLVGNNAFAAKNCTINSPNISFGTAFNPLNNTSLNVTFANVITVSCTGFNGNYTIKFAAGTYGTIPNRFMRSSTPNNLNFNIFTSATYLTPLGISNSNDINGSCGGTCTNTHTVWGRIPAQTSAMADTNQYTTAVTMTLTY